ncbi:E3 ubiquitin-protein ligase EL5-like [Lolium rigidum]|uniref:E3 ubiquitin-protein ligase EL5-like n=1 Tax=Lolium rigidum TaxID=89674 RepID=UPI001F5C79C9|nr:E3 ubiquitin-protein ligase EL5-like [Lolium rigidum]
MSSLPADDDGSVLPSARTPTTVVDGDVVFSCVALLFLALVLVFVLYHYFIVHRPVGVRVAAGTASSGPRLGAGVAASAPGAVGRKGVDPVALRALPVTLYRAKDFAEEELECAVCLADLSDGEAARFLPKCGHGFHAECVDLWLRSHPTCPLCRVDVDKPDALPPALPPVRPERANYGTNLPTNVLFWGSQDAVTTRGTAGGPRSSGGVTTIVIDVPETTSSAVVPRDGDAAKSQGLARLRSIGRLWSSRGRCEVGASSSAGSCHRVTAGARTEDSS